MINRLAEPLMVLSLFLTLSVQVRAVEIDDFEARVYVDAEGSSIPYRLFIPRDYNPSESYPLVLFLHGAGERGDDNRRQISIPSTRVWAEEATQAVYPNFMVAPQVPQGQQWVDVPFEIGSHDQPKQPTESMRLTLELLTALQKEFSIDPRRLYVTGLSMGGYGTWDMITRHPDLFAAAIPIAGGGDPSRAALIADLPLWAFHGENDTVVPVSGSRDMIDAMREAGGDPLYTEYLGAGHNVWDRAYREPELVPWLFSQARLVSSRGERHN